MTRCVIGIDSECDHDCKQLQIPFGDSLIPIYICTYEPGEVYYFLPTRAEPLTEDSEDDTLDSPVEDMDNHLTPSNEEGLIIYE